MELYKISFPLHSNKVYIGISSKSAASRFKEHCSSRKSYPIVMALRKYGAENAHLEVLGKFDSFDNLYSAEQQAISAYNSKSPNGYNLTDGGKGTFGLPASPERRLKIGLANKGRELSEEARRKISESKKGGDFSLQVEAMANANRGVKRSAETVAKMRAVWTGRKHSDESKRKMSESASKRRATESTRKKISEGVRKARGGKIFSFVSPDGVLHKVDSMSEFCSKNSLTKQCMYRVARGSLPSHKGWSSV